MTGSRRSLLLLSALPVLSGLAAGAAAQTPLVVAGGPTAQGAFGFSVATVADLDDDGVLDVLVGAPDADLGGLDSGAAYVLSGADGTILRTLAGPAPGDHFGYDVADAGDVDADGTSDFLIGASQDNPDESASWGGCGPGYAQVYSGADGSLLHTWQGEYGVTSTNYDSFGRAVLGLGDVNGDGHSDVAVAERDAEIEMLHTMDEVGGQVWVFSGLDGSVLRRIKSVGPASAHLGWSLGNAGDLDRDGVADLAMGAPIQNSGNQHRVAVVSPATGATLLSISSSITYLGYSVTGIDDVDDDGVPDLAAAGHVLAAVYSGADGDLLGVTHSMTPMSGLYTGLAICSVGDADGDDRGDFAVGAPGTPNGGAAYVYSGVDAGQIGLFMGGQASGQLGWDLDAAGDHDGDGTTELVLGSPGFDGPAGVNAGRMSIQRLVATEAQLSIYSPTGHFNQFGLVSACAGDVDNDGFADIVSGTASDSTAFLSAGRVDVFSGRDGSILHTFLGDQSNDRLGWSVASAGDVDADGYDDIVSGAPLPTAATGPAYVRLWSGRTGAPLHTFNGVSVGDQFGLAVAGIGDLDHDGHDDIAVSAPFDDTAGLNFGVVRLYSGRTFALLRTLPGAQSGSEFGYSVSAADDVNLDDTPDVIVGARLHATVNGTSSGSASVFSGSTGALLHFFPGPSSFDNAGWAVEGVGDVDGDGRPDVAVGMPFADGAAPSTGVVAVYSGLDGSEITKITSAAGAFGQAISGISDVDGDGLPDIVAGLATADDGFPDGGAVRIHNGQTGEMIVSHAGPAANDQLGYSVDASGDVDNDGRPDIVAGALGSALDPGNQGAIYAISLVGPATPWQSEGHKLPGSHGAPKLTASGSLAPAAPVSLKLSNTLENTTATLVVGSFALIAPFKGGTLVPFPQFLVFGLPTGLAGALNLSAPWPAGLPGGVTLHFQYWIVDPAGPAGFAASNAMKGTTP